MKYRYYKFFILSIFLSILFAESFTGFTQTLTDIRKTLGMDKKGPVRRKNNKSKFEIKSIKPGNIQGYQTESSDGRSVNLYGVQVTFKINEKGDIFHIPYNFCYFYDKNKNLLDRQKADFIHARGNARPTPLEGELMMPGKKVNRVVFSYPATFIFKYAVVVLGDKNNIDAMCYPRSQNFMDFDFDEKEMIK